MPVFLLPGWLNSGPTHWQSRWEVLHGYTRVEQHDWQRPLRGDWTARLEEVLLNSERVTQQIHGSQPDLALKNLAADGVVLVAHSLGCHLVAAWAAHSRNTHLVRGALLVAPPDLTQSDLPADLHNWRRPVLQALPFPSVCVISSNDPFTSLPVGKTTAAAWGASTSGGCIELGAYGHINGDSGLGDWAQGHALLETLLLKSVGSQI